MTNILGAVLSKDFFILVLNDPNTCLKYGFIFLIICDTQKENMCRGNLTKKI